MPLLSITESLYVLGLLPLEVYCSLGHHLLGLSDTLPFLPLMLTSLYVALGMLYAYVKLYWHLFTDKRIKEKKVD